MSGRRVRIHTKVTSSPSVILSYSSRLCVAFTFFQLFFFSDCALCILLDTVGTWGLYFCLCDSQNGLFFKTGIFAVFYVALWWTGAPVQTGR